jgi:hypothetical protein
VSVARLVLSDGDDIVERTTASLMASLAARLAGLFLMSGAEAIGSQIAGLAALGRQVSQTAAGARLRHAIASGRAGTSGEALWREVRVDDWLAHLPPAPVLDDLHNGVALLLADDLFDVLAERQRGYGTVARAPASPPEQADFLDFAVGVWAFGREVARAVEAIAAPTLHTTGSVDAPPQPDAPGFEGPLLR